MFKQQSSSGKQTTCLAHNKLTGVNANLQGQHILPLFNSLKAGIGLSETFCTGHGIFHKSQSDHLWAQASFTTMSVLQWYEVSPTNCTLNLKSPHQCLQTARLYKHESNSDI